jgi:hypothetical protein
LISVLVFCFVAAPHVRAATRPTPGTEGARGFSSFLAESMSRGDVPGVVVLVAAPDRVLYHEAFGKECTPHDDPCDFSTVPRRILRRVEWGGCSQHGLDGEASRPIPTLP